ncbi:hypothetical protein SOVF_045500 isoform A [Spinacia oleracea]|nr:hypothetical protein SOVF_045500 isoform A [Spinacia oleracea]
MELRTAQEVSVQVQRPIMFAPLSPCFGVTPVINRDKASPCKFNLRKVKSLTDFVSSRKLKKAYHGEGTCDKETKEDVDVQKSCSYGTLLHANFARGALDLGTNYGGDDLVYYRRHKPNVDISLSQDFGTPISEQIIQRQSPIFGISWTKGKLSFKCRRVKGEPLLKKDYGEQGGDDIDFYCRQLSSDESLAGGKGWGRLQR